VKFVFYGTLPEAYMVRDLLREHGIEAEVANEMIAGARGEAPLDLSTTPAVWIADEGRAEEAKEILEAMRRPSDAEPWTCACGEVLEGSFTSCWKCGAER
jgi:hypothetical protein